jgi:hypothetical protein
LQAAPFEGGETIKIKSDCFLLVSPFEGGAAIAAGGMCFKQLIILTEK